MAAILGVKESQIDKLRREIGPIGEHQEPTGVASTYRIWMYWPEWLPAWANRVRSSDSTHDKRRLEAAKAGMAELELAKRRGEVVTIGDMLTDLGVYADKMREGIELIGRLDPECQKIMLAKLTEAEEEFERSRGNIEHSEAPGSDATDCAESTEGNAGLS